jgi:hypothetical protein
MKEMHFFIALEKELESSFNYIEPDNANLSCYGAKFVILLNTIGIEFESLTKTLIKHKSPEAKVGNIGDIKKNLLELFPNICTNQVEITRLNEIRTPFQGWNNDGKLDWWSDFTDIKHNRINNFSRANLNTVLEAMSALVVIIIYLSRFRDNNYHVLSSGLFSHKSMGDRPICRGEPLPDFEAEVESSSAK